MDVIFTLTILHTITRAIIFRSRYLEYVRRIAHREVPLWHDKSLIGSRRKDADASQKLRCAVDSKRLRQINSAQLRGSY